MSLEEYQRLLKIRPLRLELDQSPHYEISVESGSFSLRLHDMQARVVELSLQLKLRGLTILVGKGRKRKMNTMN